MWHKAFNHEVKNQMNVTEYLYGNKLVKHGHHVN